jgi:multidrug transporter EmrE-like cation transporter
MLTALIFPVISGLLWAVVGLIMSLVARRGMKLSGVMVTSACCSATIGWIVIPRHAALFAGEVSRAAAVVPMMLGVGLTSFLAFSLMQIALRRGHHGIIWTIGQSSLIIPFTVGIVAYGNNATVTNILGVVCVLCALVAFGMSKRDGNALENGRWFPIALLCMVIIGLQQTLNSIPSQWKDWSDVARIRVPLVYTGTFLGYGTHTILRRHLPTWREMKLGFIQTAISLTSLVIHMEGMDRLRHFNLVNIAYPIATGVCILGFALYSLLVLKEHATKATLLGFAAGLIGIALFFAGALLQS